MEQFLWTKPPNIINFVDKTCFITKINNFTGLIFKFEKVLFSKSLYFHLCKKRQRAIDNSHFINFAQMEGVVSL